MTRLGRIRPRGDFDLAEAFKFLASGTRSDRDLATAARLLHESGFEELVFGDDLVAIAEENGSSAIDALDLVVVFDRGIENFRVRSPRQRVS